MKDCPNGWLWLERSSQHIEMVITGAMLELGRSPVLTAGAVAPDITCYAPVITCSAPAITCTYTMHTTIAVFSTPGQKCQGDTWVQLKCTF